MRGKEINVIFVLEFVGLVIGVRAEKYTKYRFAKIKKCKSRHHSLRK